MSQERLSVDAAAERLGTTPDAVRSRIKRGTLWAVRRDGRVQVVIEDWMVRGPGGGQPSTRIPTNHLAPGGVADDAPGDMPGDTALRLRAELARQKHRARALEAARDRLLRHLEAQYKFLDLECALRARLQDQIDRLCDRLATALPEALGDPTEAPTGSGTRAPERGRAGAAGLGRGQVSERPARGRRRPLAQRCQLS